MEWQPIETAPKDGRRILLADMFENVEIGFWNRDLGQWMDDAQQGWIEPTWPTHWMAIPQPPQIEG